jgi:tRNA threonylcarbamoyl adenosine modification protein (Sua5/YciO/YrdC/YwlC family)
MDQKGNIIRTVSDGGIVVMPTDTVLGLVCSAFDEKAVQKIYEIKGRDPLKPFVVLVSKMRMLELLNVTPTPAEHEHIKTMWPGPHTFVFGTTSDKQYLHRNTGTLAVRLPDDQNLQEIINSTGPIVATSANLSGQKVFTSSADAKRVFGEAIDLYIESTEPLVRSAVASKIFRVDGQMLQQIR